MTLIIARKEFTEMWRDGRLRWSAAIVLTLLLASVAVGWKHYREVGAQHAQAQNEMRDMWVNQPAKNPHSAAHYGLWAFKPKMPLSLVDRGVDAYVGVAAYLEAHKQNEFKYRPAMDATAVQRFGEWTAAAVLQLLLPLLIIVLAFSAFAGEREQGTLRQLASLGVPARSLATGKALGVAGALFSLLLPAAVIGGVALTFTVNGGSASGDLTRVLLMVLSYLAYFAVFVAVTLLVSLRAPSARVALIVLLGFWTLNSLIAPRAMSDIARRAYPTPSAFTFMAGVDADLKQGIDGHSPDARADALAKTYLAQYGVATVDSLPLNFDAVQMQQGEEDGDKVFDKHYGALYDRYRRQNIVHQMGALFAPMMAVRSLSMSLAGTDIEQHRDFANAAELYRRMLVKEMNGAMESDSRTGDWAYKAPPELWARIPEFSYTAPHVMSILRFQRWSIGLLLAWLVVSAIGLLRTRHLRVN